MTKPAISPAKVAHAKRASRAGRAPPVPTYVARAMAAEARDGSMQDLIAALVAERGEPTPEEVAWASRAFWARSKG